MSTGNKLTREKQKIFAECECKIGSCIDCQKKASRIDRYHSAGIPTIYWKSSFKDFVGDKNFANVFRGYLKDINRIYDEGSSIILVGSLGVGKTYSTCCLLKIAIVNDYSAIYTTMADIVNQVIRDNSGSYIQSLLSADFLAIDELDPRWIFPSEKSEQLFGSTMEYLLRSRFQNGLPTIMCSNADDVDKIFAGNFGRTFKSLRTHHVEVIYVGGKDHRRKTC
jgi:DNA replication protein DnaC